MLLTEREKKICAEYGAYDESGHVRCNECPLSKGNPAQYDFRCKANSHYDRKEKDWVYDEGESKEMAFCSNCIYWRNERFAAPCINCFDVDGGKPSKYREACNSEPVLTNYDAIQSMRPDELAEWVFEVICWAVAIGERHDCKYNGEYLTFPFMTKDELGRDVIQRQTIEKWLKEKADDSFKG